MSQPPEDAPPLAEQLAEESDGLSGFQKAGTLSVVPGIAALSGSVGGSAGGGLGAVGGALGSVAALGSALSDGLSIGGSFGGGTIGLNAALGAAVSADFGVSVPGFSICGFTFPGFNFNLSFNLSLILSLSLSFDFPPKFFFALSLNCDLSNPIDGDFGFGGGRVGQQATPDPELTG